VIAHDEAGNSGYDTSNGNFEIYLPITIVYIEDASAMQNEEATTAIIINTNEANGIGSATIKLYYDPSVVVVTSVGNGELGSVIYNIDNTNGVTTMTAAIATSPGPTGIVYFANITFKAVGNAGDSSSLHLEVISLYDATPETPQPIDYTIMNGSIYINDYINDTIPPVTTLQYGVPYYNNGNDWITSSTPIYLNATDDGTGINSTWYRIWHNGWSSWMAYIAPFFISQEGLNYIEYYSIDNAGNVENIKNASIHVDNTPPITTLLLYHPFSPSGNEGFKIMLVVGELLSR